MMKKGLLRKLTCVVLMGSMLLSFAACRRNETNTQDNPGAANNNEQNFSGRRITVGIWGGNDAEEAAIEKVRTDFEEKTGATVEFKVYTDYNTQIQADFIGRTAPDVFYVDANVFPFFSTLDVLEVLDPEEMEADQFYENLIAAFTSKDGELMSIPKDVSTLALYYNEELLAECGYTADDIPDSLEGLKTFLPELQKKLDDKYGAGMVASMTYLQDLARNLHLLERNGGEVAKEDGTSTLSNDEVVKNLEFLVSMVNTGAMKTPADLGLGWNGEAFGTGKCVLMEEGNWVYGTLVSDYSDIKFGVKDMPKYLDERSSMSYTVGYSIFRESNEKELAREWIKYATGTEGMYTWCSGSGTLPSRSDVGQALDIENNPELATHLAQIDFATPWQRGTTISLINDSYINFVPSAFRGEVSAREAMENADEQANGKIQSAR